MVKKSLDYGLGEVTTTPDGGAVESAEVVESWLEYPDDHRFSVRVSEVHPLDTENKHEGKGSPPESNGHKFIGCATLTDPDTGNSFHVLVKWDRHTGYWWTEKIHPQTEVDF